MSELVAGVLPIVHTPFFEDETIDYESLDRQVDWALAHGARGYCTGMVSELLRLTADERVELHDRLARLRAGRGVFVASVGAESIPQAVEFAEAAERSGCDAIMATPPMSAAAPEGQLLEYFRTLVERTAVPLIVQDASSYVGQSIPLGVCVELLESYGSKRVWFKPEANPIGPHISALRDATSGRARIFDGSGGIALVDSYRRGIVGSIPGMEFLPGIVALWNALERNDESSIYELYLPICALVNLQLQAGLDGFLAVEKHVLHHRGLIATDVRRQPYTWEMDEETGAELQRLMSQLDKAVRRVTVRQPVRSTDTTP
jgi:4-hydroxy-tetrahydrodipicolinate synthase